MGLGKNVLGSTKMLLQSPLMNEILYSTSYFALKLRGFTSRLHSSY